MDVNDTQDNGPDEPTAEQPTAPQAPAGEPGPRRLTRSRADRVIGGVCGGLGRYFNLDPLLFRIGAVALVFLGGAGILLYLAMLLLVPNEDETAPIVPGTQGRNRGFAIAGVVVLLLFAFPFLLGGGLLFAGIGIPLAILVSAGVLVWWLVSGEGPSGDAGDIARRAALGLAVLVGCFILFFVAGFGAAAGPDWLIPALVVVAGVAIVAGAFVKPVRWLVAPALTVALAAGIVAAAGIDTGGGIGQREYRPGSSVDLRDHYELGIGELVVDLRNTDLPKGDVPIDLDVGIGEARVIVPDNVCVATAGDVGVGNVHVRGRDHGGVDVNYEDSPSANPTATRVLVHGDVGLGELRVQNNTEELYFGGRNFGPDQAPTRSPACTTG
jgi:phage shock protein PspC (stress-responsive transcriptional regulator)